MFWWEVADCFTPPTKWHSSTFTGGKTTPEAPSTPITTYPTPWRYGSHSNFISFSPKKGAEEKSLKSYVCKSFIYA